MEIKTPDFLKVQLATYAGLADSVSMLSEVFHRRYQAIINGTGERKDFDLTAMFHREIAKLFFKTYTGNEVPDTLVVNGGLTDFFLMGYDNMPVDTNIMILQVFDQYYNDGLVNLSDDNLSLYQGLRITLIEIVTSFYTRIDN